MTSISSILNKKVSMDKVKNVLVCEFEKVFLSSDVKEMLQDIKEEIAV
jgi:hypothetical protein